MGGDLGGAPLGEVPAGVVAQEVELGDLQDFKGGAQRSSVPPDTMTAEPPIEAARSAPPSAVMVSAIRLGRPISKSLFDRERRLAVAGPLEFHDDAREGRRRAAGRRIFGDAPVAREHPGVKGGAGPFDLGRIEVSGRTGRLRPGQGARARAAHGLQRAQRHEQVRRAGRIEARRMGAEADVVGLQPEGGGDLRGIGEGARQRLRQAGKVEGRRESLARAPTRDADDVADLFLQNDPQILRREQRGRPQLGEQAGGPDRRVAGEGEFAPRREDAQPRCVYRIARLEDEDGLGQVEFARDALHARIVKAIAIDDDGERIALKRRLGKDVERVKAARQSRDLSCP